MKTKRTWTACIALSLSVLCGSVPAYATEPVQESIAQQDVQIQAPAQVQAAALETGGVQLTWDAVPDASGYRIYRRNQDAWELLHIVKKAEKTSYIDKTTVMQTEYTYMLRAYTQTNGTIKLGAASQEVTATTVAVLGTPVMRAATSNDPNSLTISWNAVGGATGYEVFRKAEGEQDWSRMAETSGLYATSYVDHSVVCGKAYSYTVRACCEKNGNRIYGTYDPQGIVGRAVPEAPTLTASSNSSTSVSLSWTKVSGANGYRVHRKTDANGTWTYVNSVGENNTGYQDSGLTAGKRYYYAVAAYCTLPDGSQYIGDLSAAVSVVPKLAAPSLKSVAMGKKGLVFQWNTVSEANGYIIYRKADGGSWSQIATVGSGVTSYEDSGSLKDGGAYVYTAAAKMASGEAGLYNTNGLRGVYYSYQAAINSGTLPDNIALPNVRKETFGTSAEGRALNAYTVGTGAKHMVLNFAIHGWEDNWNRDGYELVRVSVQLLEKLSANASTVTNRGWSVTVVPYVNPDGIVSGTTNDGPGRCSTYRYNTSDSLVKGGVDMNRCFPTGFKQYTSARNYTGPNPLMAKEARALKSLIDNKKGSSTNVYMDVHGWTQQILTNTSGSGFVYATMHQYFPNNSAGGLGGGYVTRYAKEKGYSACLFEFPRNVTSHSVMVNKGYHTKFVNAIWSMITNH